MEKYVQNSLLNAQQHKHESSVNRQAPQQQWCPTAARSDRNGPEQSPQATTLQQVHRVHRVHRVAPQNATQTKQNSRQTSNESATRSHSHCLRPRDHANGSGHHRPDQPRTDTREKSVPNSLLNAQQHKHESSVNRQAPQYQRCPTAASSDRKGPEQSPQATTVQQVHRLHRVASEKATQTKQNSRRQSNRPQVAL